jgi:hypothetical protein
MAAHVSGGVVLLVVLKRLDSTLYKQKIPWAAWAPWAVFITARGSFRMSDFMVKSYLIKSYWKLEMDDLKYLKCQA